MGTMKDYFTIKEDQYNIAYYCTKHQCEIGNAEKTAIRWIFPDMSKKDYSFGFFEAQSNQVANALQNLGVKKGDPVFTFIPRVPELFSFFLGILKIEAIAGILFSNFGEEALLDRLGDSKARVLLTNKNFLRKINNIWSELPNLEFVVLIDAPDHQTEKVLSFEKLIQDCSKEYETPITSRDTPSVLHYTSGSTGKPKGVLHIHGSIFSQVESFREILSVEDGDLFWCTADQGWVTGVSYGIIAPMSQGITQIQFSGSFRAEKWFDILQEEKVNNWYTAPTALRMLMMEDDALFKKYDLSNLKHIFSVGEPLNPAIIEWARRLLDKNIYDTWFQTETGAIMIANRPGLEIRPGSMGKPFMGEKHQIEAAILDDDGKEKLPGEEGHLCVKPGWPSMFVDYINRTDVYNAKFKNGWYDTSDVAFKDEDGYFWFFGRDDDVINTSGHLVGPFEIESALLEKDAVIEAGVIGAPDEVTHEKVVAYIRLNAGLEWSKALELDLRLHISNKLSAVATPQEFIVVDSVPKNKSGKIMRRVLKAWYTGGDVGDISTMEEE